MLRNRFQKIIFWMCRNRFKLKADGVETLQWDQDKQMDVWHHRKKKKNNCGNNSRVKNYFLESISKIFVRNISCTKAWEEVWYRWDIYPSLGLNHHTLITVLISSLTPRLPRCVALNIITVAINVNNVSEIIITTGAAAQLKKKKKNLNYSCSFLPGPKTIYTLMQTDGDRDGDTVSVLTLSQQRTYGDVLVLKSHGRPSGRGPVANLQDGPQENSQQALHDELHLLWHHGLLQRGEKTHTHRSTQWKTLYKRRGERNSDANPTRHSDRCDSSHFPPPP